MIFENTIQFQARLSRACSIKKAKNSKKKMISNNHKKNSMHPEIENLINMALADGEVTEKERGIINNSYFE